MIPTKIGPYQIERKIGSGGMGSVYLGRHESTGEVAAVKLLPSTLAADPGFVERFIREIDSLSRLQHPNIVRLFLSGSTEDSYYYSMEYVSGDTLTQIIKQEKRLDWKRAVEICLQICAALRSAHDHGIVHRDLKPSNLIITPDGTVKLMDFGVAQVFSSAPITMTGGVIGTPEFMSPEQAEGRRVTPQSDLYALGAVLYTMICGRPPFTGNTPVDIIQKQKFGRFDRPKMYVETIPMELDELISQLLAKDPAERCPDSRVVSRRLERILEKAVDDETDVTEAAIATPRGPGPATIARQFVREELSNKPAPGSIQALFDNFWILSLLLLGVVSLTVYLTWFSDLTPEQKFERGIALMSQPPGEAWIKAKSEYFDPLLKDDPETWSEQIEPYLHQIELEKIGTAKRKILNNRAGDANRLLRESMEKYQIGDRTRAVSEVKALLLVLSQDETQEELVLLCERILKAWEETPEGDPFDWLKPAMEKAAQDLVRDPDSAIRTYEAIALLYQKDPQAKAILRLVQEKIEKANQNLHGTKKKE